MVDRGWDNCIDVFFSTLNFFFGNVLLKSWDYLLPRELNRAARPTTSFFLLARPSSAARNHSRYDYLKTRI